jgi:hypothetical protein
MTSMKATDNSASSTMEGSGGDLSGGGMGGGMGVGVGVGGGGGLRRVSALHTVQRLECSCQRRGLRV